MAASAIPTSPFEPPRASAEAIRNVRMITDFGAKCDWNGTSGTDDTAAIQAALNEAGGSTVQIPAADCLITRTLFIYHEGTILKGISGQRGRSRLVMKSGLPQLVDGLVVGAGYGRLEDFIIDGQSNKTGSLNRGIVFYVGQRELIYEVKVINARGDGLLIDDYAYGQMTLSRAIPPGTGVIVSPVAPPAGGFPLVAGNGIIFDPGKPNQEQAVIKQVIGDGTFRVNLNRPHAEETTMIMKGSNNFAKVEHCLFAHNGRNGAEFSPEYGLAADDNAIELSHNEFQGNGENGLLLRGSSALILGGFYSGNGQHPIQVGATTDPNWSSATIYSPADMEYNGAGDCIYQAHSVRSLFLVSSATGKAICDGSPSADGIQIFIDGGNKLRITDTQSRELQIVPSSSAASGAIVQSAASAPNYPLSLRSKGSTAIKLNILGGSGGTQFGDGSGNVVAGIDKKGKAVFSGGIAFGEPGTARTRFERVAASISPSKVGPRTCMEQPLPFSGVHAQDLLSFVTPPAALPPGISLPNLRVIRDGVVGFQFCNSSDDTATPPSGVYTFMAVQ